MTKKEVTGKVGQDRALNENDLASDARRRLLKLGAYVPPAIIGMAIIGSIPGGAHASGDDKKDGGGGANMSCNPNACNPCLGGGKTKRQQRQDARDCLIAQRKRTVRR